MYIKRGRIITEEFRQKQREGATNPSQETRLKMRLAKIGKTQALEHIMKRVVKNTGKQRTEESKERSRLALIGKNKGKVRTLEMRRRMSASHKPENHASWKGGITPINGRIRKSLEYKLWREAVFARDNYRCFDCGSRSEKGVRVVLNADHIYPFAYFPRLRFVAENGRTLCLECHRKTNTFGRKVLKKYEYAI